MLSLRLRKYRDSLPVDQLEEFIPHLKEAKFLGGEPFLIDIYYKIWDKIIELNPSVKITITTNGTVFNKRVQEILEKLDCNIIMSIDAFNKTTYESIRIQGDYEKIWQRP